MQPCNRLANFRLFSMANSVQLRLSESSNFERKPVVFGLEETDRCLSEAPTLKVAVVCYRQSAIAFQHSLVYAGLCKLSLSAIDHFTEANHDSSLFWYFR
jgi:hypothetical protein